MILHMRAQLCRGLHIRVVFFFLSLSLFNACVYIICKITV